MSIGNRIMELRKEAGYNRNQFAEYIGIPSTTLRNYELGSREPGHPFLIQMSYIFNVSTDYLLCLTDDRSPVYVNSDLAIFDNEEIETIKNFHKLNVFDKKTVSSLILSLVERRAVNSSTEFINIYPPKLIPNYGFLASAGTGQFIFDDIPPTMEEVTDGVNADFIIGVNGDSMEPTYFDGEELLVKKQKSIIPGCIGVFMIDGQSFVKELGKGVLISHNKKYQDILITEDTRCVGKVVGVHTKKASTEKL